MPFTIPNTPASPTAEQSSQSMPDQYDFEMLNSGIGLTAVVNGCGVTPLTGMLLTVGSGLVTLAGVDTIINGAIVTIATADATNPRFDLCYIDATGGPASVAGTPAPPASGLNPGPVFPAIPANSVVIAAVYVGAGVTTINAADIIDKRVTAPPRFAMSPTNPQVDITIPRGPSVLLGYAATVQAQPLSPDPGRLLTLALGSCLALEEGAAGDYQDESDLNPIRYRPSRNYTIRREYSAAVPDLWWLDAGRVLTIDAEGIFAVI